MAEDPGAGPDGPVDTEPRPLRPPTHRNALPSPPPSRSPAQLAPPSPVVDESAEPSRQAPADVVVSPRRIFVTVEVPDGSRETLGIEATDRRLTVTARDTRGFLYHREIALPDRVDPGSARSTYRNGVLDVVLRRVASPKTRLQEDERDG